MNIIQMLRYLVATLLVTSILGGIVGFSGTRTKIYAPQEGQAVIATMLNQHSHLWDVIPKASWIWSTDGINTPHNDYIEVRHKFWSRCTKPMSLRIAAFGDWKVYWNGEFVKEHRGFDDRWKQVKIIELNPVQCGPQELKIIATKNRPSSDWAGLVFRLDQEDCRCPSNKWLNPSTCGCQCRDVCPCSSEKEWDPDSCSCKCKLLTIQRNSYGADLKSCRPGGYWDEAGCMCKCLPRECPKPGMVLSPVTCKCYDP